MTVELLHGEIVVVLANVGSLIDRIEERGFSLAGERIHHDAMALIDRHATEHCNDEKGCERSFHFASPRAAWNASASISRSH